MHMSDRDFSYVGASARFIDKRFATLKREYYAETVVSRGPLLFAPILRDFPRFSPRKYFTIPKLLSSLFTSFRIQPTIPACSRLDVILHLHIFHLAAVPFRTSLSRKVKRIWMLIVRGKKNWD